MLSSKQQEYLANCNHRWNVKVGATGSGKSWLDYAYVIPKRVISLKGQGAAVILGNTQGTISRNILEPMRSIYGEHLISSIKGDNSIRVFGRKVYILGADKRNNVDRIRGMTIEYAYGDEMTTWSQEVFEMLKSRLRCEHSCFDGTANPESPYHYIKKFLDSDADIFCQKSTIFDNPFLPKEFVRNLCKEYEGTVYYNRYILGEWALAEGVIYDMFSEDTHVAKEIQEPLTETRYLSCDYGTQNATVFLLWQKAKSGVWYCVDEYYYSGREQGRQKTDAQYVDDLKIFLGDRDVKAIIVDPSAASFIEALRQSGFSVIKADNEVVNGIRQVSGLLNKGGLKFTTACKKTIEEFGTYVWDDRATERGKDVPMKVNDHSMDAVRYFVNTVIGKKAIISSKKKRGFY